MWIPYENIDPVVLNAPTRKGISTFGAVCAADGRFTYMISPTFNAMTFQVFIKQLLRRRRRNRKMVIILDNARWHHAKLIKPWLHKHRHLIKLFFLPPYSPHLNPMERVWKLTRYLCTHNQYFDSIFVLSQQIQQQFEKWNKRNYELFRLCAII